MRIMIVEGITSITRNNIMPEKINPMLTDSILPNLLEAFEKDKKLKLVLQHLIVSLKMVRLVKK